MSLWQDHHCYVNLLLCCVFFVFFLFLFLVFLQILVDCDSFSTLLFLSVLRLYVQAGSGVKKTKTTKQNMKTSMMFQTLFVLSTAFIIFLISVYWRDEGVIGLNFPALVSPGHRPPSPAKQKSHTSQCSQQSDIDAFIYQFVEPGICEAMDSFPVDSANQSEKARPGWAVHQTPIAPELTERQVGFL